MSIELETIVQLAQRCLETMPVIILGSGASMPYGVGGMSELQQHLQRAVSPTPGDESALDSFKKSLKITNDLEKSLQETTLPDTVIRSIVLETRARVLADDLTVFNRVVANPQELQLSRLYRHLFNSTHTTLSVVTTNYDRLAEYAADAAGYNHETGFSPGFYRSFIAPGTRPQTPDQQRTVQVWKVHGSVDWYLDDNQIALALPFGAAFPESLTPLLVTPGARKYEQTHSEPFRSIITQADTALQGAAGYLSLGYGFNDIHIQPKLVQRVRTSSTPIVILARTLTPNAREFLSDCNSSQFLALEKSGESGTKAYCREQPEGIELPGSSLWDFPHFLDAIFGPN